MSTFDYDDDVRRMESDELHGIAGGWYDKDPTPPHGIERPRPDRCPHGYLSGCCAPEAVGTHVHHDDRIPTDHLGIAQVWPDSYRYDPVASVTGATAQGVES